MESFTVVVATGIVAVAARGNGQPLVRCVFAAGADCGLALIIVWLVVARIRTGRAVARGRNPFDRTFGLFGFVAATDVVAAQFDPMTADRTLLLVMALAAWVAVVTRLVAVLLASDIAALQADVHGSLRRLLPRTDRPRSCGDAVTHPWFGMSPQLRGRGKRPGGARPVRAGGR